MDGTNLRPVPEEFRNLSIVPGRSERRPRFAIQAEYRNEIADRPSVAAFWRGQTQTNVFQVLDHVLHWMRRNLIAVQPRIFFTTPRRPNASITSWNWWRVMAMVNSTMADQVNIMYDFLMPRGLQHGFIIPRNSGNTLFDRWQTDDHNRLRYSVNTY